MKFVASYRGKSARTNYWKHKKWLIKRSLDVFTPVQKKDIMTLHTIAFMHESICMKAFLHTMVFDAMGSFINF